MNARLGASMAPSGGVGSFAQSQTPAVWRRGKNSLQTCPVYSWLLVIHEMSLGIRPWAHSSGLKR